MTMYIGIYYIIIAKIIVILTRFHNLDDRSVAL